MEYNPHCIDSTGASRALVAHSTPQLRARIDGWTPERQRLFCETLADCGLVIHAAKAVGMSPQSAYTLRRRVEGRSFALAWDAAFFLARQRLIDDAIAGAVEGNVDVIIKDGEVIGERRRKDSRVLLGAIARLDDMVYGNRKTRVIAEAFDDFLDCVEADANQAITDANQAITDAGTTGQSAVTATPRDSRASDFLTRRGEKSAAPQRRAPSPRSESGRFLPRD
jgi:hypothetical protein